MSLASDLASIESDVVAYLPTAVQLFEGVAASVTQAGASSLTKAIGVASTVAMVADTIPNADVEAAGGLLGLITSLLGEFVPAKTVAAAKTTQTANATAAAASPVTQTKIVPQIAVVSPAVGSAEQKHNNIFSDIFHHGSETKAVPTLAGAAK